MASCTDIDAALARLEAKIDSIPRVDEDAIVSKSIKGAESLLKPEILSVGVVAGGAVITATRSASAATIAKELADDALKLGGQALGKIGIVAGNLASLASRFAGILGLVLNIIATIATFAILSSRIDALERVVATQRELINALNGKVDTAVKKSNEAISSASAATNKASLAIGKSDTAIKDSREALQSSNQAVLKSNIATQKADIAIADSNEALKGANSSILKSNIATEKAEIAIAESSKALAGANSSILKSNIATEKAEIAIGASTTATQKADGAASQSSIAILKSETATGRADTATLKAREALDSANFLHKRLDEFEQGVRAIHADFVARLGIAVTYFTETVRAISEDLIGTVAIQRRRIEVVEGQLANTNQLSKTALATASGVSLKIPPLEQGVTEAKNNADVANKHGLKIYEPQIFNQQLRKTGVVVPVPLDQFRAEMRRTIEQDFPFDPAAVRRVALTDAKAEIQRTIDRDFAFDPRAVRPISIEQARAEIATALGRVNTSPALKTLTKDVVDLKAKVTNQETVNNAAIPLLTQIQQQINTIPRPTVPTTDQIKNALSPGLLAIPAAVGAIILPNLLTPAQVKTAAKTGTCEASQPGGCGGGGKSGLGGLTDNLATKADLALQAGQGALLASMNSTLLGMKGVLGTQILSGGISASLGRFMSSSVVDRAINLVTCAGVIHNCLMLSNSIQESFFEVLDNIVAIPQLIKDPNGETIDTKQQFTKATDTFFSGVFGASEYAAIKAQWKSYSTIFNSGAQIFGQARDIFQETQQIQTTTNNWVAELGNGLTEEGVISEDNWDYKDSNQTPSGGKLGRLEGIRKGLQTVENVFEDLEQITQSARSIVDAANEIKTNTDVIKTAITTANSAAKADRETQVEGLELPNFSLDNLY